MRMRQTLILSYKCFLVGTKSLEEFRDTLLAILSKLTTAVGCQPPRVSTAMGMNVINQDRLKTADEKTIV